MRSPTRRACVPENSWNLSFRTAPAASALTHILPVYVPAVVAVTQFGESWSVANVVVVVPVFVICAAQPPEWPPETRVRVTFAPDPDVFQPVRLVSKPGFLT